MHTQMNKNSFGSIPRRKLLSGPNYNPYLKLCVDPPRPLQDVHELNITISGVHTPLGSDWISILSPDSVKQVHLLFVFLSLGRLVCVANPNIKFVISVLKLCLAHSYSYTYNGAIIWIKIFDILEPLNANSSKGMVVYADIYIYGSQFAQHLIACRAFDASSFIMMN